jgi:hypothetical protein
VSGDTPGGDAFDDARAATGRDHCPFGDLTDKDVAALERKAKGLRAAGQVQEIGNELAALASTPQ